MAEKKGTAIRREEIVSAALTLMSSQGVRSMTIERIASIVGIVPSAVYRHFGNKSEIIAAVLTMIVARMQRNITEVSKENNNSLTAIRMLLMRQIQLVKEFMVIPHILFSEEVYSENPALKTKLHDLINGFLGALAVLIRRGQKEGSIRPDLEPLRVATMFLGLFQPSAFLYHLSGGTFDVVKQVDISWKLFSSVIKRDGKKGSGQLSES
jgi:AcrR family transcriptional regulator